LEKQALYAFELKNENKESNKKVDALRKNSKGKLFHLLALTIVIFTMQAKAKMKKGSWSISLAAYVIHNDVLKDPGSNANFNYCTDYDAFQSYPTWGGGGGIIFKKTYPSQLSFKTGFALSVEKLTYRRSKEIASHYLSPILMPRSRRMIFINT
jgi:hypothetical protein